MEKTAQMHPTATKAQFLTLLQESGNVVECCEVLQLSRSTAYSWRSDPQFELIWQQALQVRRDYIRSQIEEKALLATGNIVEDFVRDDNGEVLLDENFEPMKAKRLVDYDASILRAMIAKYIESADGPTQTAVSVNVENSPFRELPPEESTRRPTLVEGDYEVLDA